MIDCLQIKHHEGIITLFDPIVMGILNLTPDSFSDGGKYTQTTDAVKHAENL